MVGLPTINERADTRQKKSRRTNELIIIIYTLHSPYHSHLSSSLCCNFKNLCLVFQVVYHGPTLSNLRDHQVPGRDLSDLSQYLTYQIMDSNANNGSVLWSNKFRK